ncbi:MAG: hypothetical protein ACI9DC_000910 [Gammaproteobacteria bacterium]|jgi:hypothetical protein
MREPGAVYSSSSPLLCLKRGQSRRNTQFIVALLPSVATQGAPFSVATPKAETRIAPGRVIGRSCRTTTSRFLVPCRPTILVSAVVKMKDKQPLNFYRDAAGHVRAQGDDERLATFLETDCQSSIEVCEELLCLLDNEHSRCEFIGNAHHVAIATKTVTIESTADPDAPDRRLNRAEFQRAISDWLAFIKRPKSLTDS